ETDDPSGQVEILQGGRQLRAVKLSAERTVDLPAGEYERRLVSGRAGLRLTPDRVTLRRGGTATVAVRPIPGYVGQIRAFQGHIRHIFCVDFSADRLRALSAR